MLAKRKAHVFGGKQPLVPQRLSFEEMVLPTQVLAGKFKSIH